MTDSNIDPYDCDILIVGYGIAGACAAIEAREAGADVLVLERASAGGGTSALSEGVIYLGGGTRLQSDLGVADDVDTLYDFMNAGCGVADKAMLRRFCEGAPDHFDWLEAHGVPFRRELCTSKLLCPPNGPGLYSSSNEKAWPFRAIAHPAYRGHLVDGPSGNSGARLMAELLARCEELGVRVIGDARVTALEREPDGRATGARFRSAGKDGSARARKGIVIATGGFQMNRDMVARDNRFLLEHGVAIGSDYSDGCGITLAQAIGADTESIGAIHATACFYPPSDLLKGIIVNRLGQRFVAEDSYHGRTAAFIFDQPDRKAWLIVDSATFAYPELAEAFQYRLVDGWETVAEMEEALEMPRGTLQDTLAAYNEFAAEGRDPQCGKHGDWLTPLDQGPYAAFDFSADQVLYHYHSLGGLRVDRDARVIGTDGAPIPGLYAAGSCAANIIQSAKGYGSGMTLAGGSFFGRIAAQHALS